MIGQALRDLQSALNHKADIVQHEFIELGDTLQALSRKILELRGADPAPLLAEQAALRERQQALAAESNLWRDRARAVLRQPSDSVLEAYLSDLLVTEDEAVRAAAERARYLLGATEEQLQQEAQIQAQARPNTPAGRLLERARTEYDLRAADPAARQRSAFEFANRPGLAQSDEALPELEAALASSDPLVQDLATLALIQIFRFRAMRLGDLDAAHAAVERLTRFKHPAVIPVLIEVLETPRTGFSQGPNGALAETGNLRSRAVAMAGLAARHTPEAQSAVRARLRDRDTLMVRAAQAVLAANPGDWR